MKIELTRVLNTTKLFGIIKSEPDSGELQKSLASDRVIKIRGEIK